MAGFLNWLGRIFGKTEQATAKTPYARAGQTAPETRVGKVQSKTQSPRAVSNAQPTSSTTVRQPTADGVRPLGPSNEAQRAKPTPPAVAAGAGPSRPSGSITAALDPKHALGSKVTARPVERSGGKIPLERKAIPPALLKEPIAPTKEERTTTARDLAARIDNLPLAIALHSQEAAMSCWAAPEEITEYRIRLASGSNHAVSGAVARREIEIVLGVDFGTTSTKIAARLPYEAGSPVYAIPVLPCVQAEAHPYLWASRIWLDPQGGFSLVPKAGAAVYCSIKTSLMSPSGDGISVLRCGEVEATAEEAACAFLALQIRQARGWLMTERKVLTQRGQLTWSYNFGFPAASLNFDILRRRYEHCVLAALSLANDKVDVTVVTSRAELRRAAHNTVAQLERARAQLVPEIAAAVAGFAQSALLDDGLYALVDVGGGTVDCCSFNLFKTKDGGAKCPIFAADVSMLGVEPWRVCAADLQLANYFRWELDRRQRSIIWLTKMTGDPRSGRWKEGLPMFLIGGGSRSDVHAASVARLDAWLKKSNSNGGGVRLVRLPAYGNLDHPLCSALDVDRLSVGIGLSLPAVDMPEITLPNAIENVSFYSVRSADHRYVGKEHT